MAVCIDASGLHFRALNERIRAALDGGERAITVEHVCGQRYLGAGLTGSARVVVRGVPGNDLGAFMDGPEIVVHGNAQDGVANTMNAGCIVIHGDCGDIPGHAMRGGCLYVRGRVGYRAGIHMKASGSRLPPGPPAEARKGGFPVVVVGTTAEDYLGEYMAGGILLVLDLDRENGRSSPVAEYVGTGMHGGAIYLRGQVEPWQLGAEVGVEALAEHDWTAMRAILADYGAALDVDVSSFAPGDFVKLLPRTTRPYGTLYAY